MNVIYHIRRPLKKQKGNQFYRDRSIRSNGTYCGAPETSQDIACKDRAERWTNDENTTYIPCRECCKALRSDKHYGRHAGGFAPRRSSRL